LRVDLDASVANEGLAEQSGVLPEDLCVPGVAEFVEEPRGAFDVREEERDGTGGQVRSGHDAREHTFARATGADLPAASWHDEPLGVIGWSRATRRRGRA